LVSPGDSLYRATEKPLEETGMKRAGQNIRNNTADYFVVNNISIETESCRIIAELESSGETANHMLAVLLAGLFVFRHHSVLDSVEACRLDLNITFAGVIAARMKDCRHGCMTEISYICDFFTKLTRKGKRPDNLMSDVRHILMACTAAYKRPHPFSGTGVAARTETTGNL
jgi:hypothetical protein